jgi:valyl-tRNA synthetase
MGRNFSNKIWNAYRFLSMNLEKVDCDYSKYKENFELADRWILSRFQKSISDLNKSLDRFRVNEGLNSIYQFFWHDYCDWYLELIKKRLYQKENETLKNTALSIASHIMKETMSLLHPFVPFITEEVWQTFKAEKDESIVISNWPAADKSYVDIESEKEMQIIQESISAIRNIRAEMNVPPGKLAPLYVRANKEQLELIKEYFSYFNSLAKVESIDIYNEELKDEATTTAVVHGAELFIPLADLIDVEKEKTRLTKEIERLELMIKGIKAKLNNENFVKKAPEHIVQVEKDKLQNNKENLAKLRTNYKKLVY